ncbi:MAG: VOC family protein [Candidatus Kapaibacterium sp.]
MNSFAVYLTFDGNCREAMDFYKSVFGGDLNRQTFRDGPMEIPESHKDKIMHASLAFGDVRIMASDSMPGSKVIKGNNIQLSLNLDDESLQSNLFNSLSQGGKVEYELQDTFWGARFGMLTDKFGIRWMMHIEKETNQG